MTRTVLSIDWDFFLYRACEAKDLRAIATAINGQEIDLLHMFDWGHNEAQSAVLAHVVWMTRWMSFKAMGLDPLIHTGILKDRGCTAPEEFLASVSEIFDLQDADINVSDSHRWGYDTVYEAYEFAGSPVDVVHFDAHHDLGYGPKRLSQHIKDETWDCGDWLFHALRLGYTNSITVVYPDWVGMREREGLADNGMLDVLKRYNLRFTTYSEWLQKPDAPSGPVESVHLARSGAWTPPWFDADFQRLVLAFPKGDQARCFDCEYENPHNACTPRTWSDPGPWPNISSTAP